MHDFVLRMGAQRLWCSVKVCAGIVGKYYLPSVEHGHSVHQPELHAGTALVSM